MSTALNRARDYLANLPPAIAGQGGHNATFWPACWAVRFGLNEGEAMTLLQEFNQRCQPPWTEKAGMHVSLPSESKVRVNKREQELRDLAEAILAAVERPCLAWREWVEAIADTTKKAPSTAEKRFDQMRALGVVRKTAFAQWELA